MYVLNILRGLGIQNDHPLPLEVSSFSSFSFSNIDLEWLEMNLVKIEEDVNQLEALSRLEF